jgi:hypothetical protein
MLFCGCLVSQLIFLIFIRVFGERTDNVRIFEREIFRLLRFRLLLTFSVLLNSLIFLKIGFNLLD